MISQDFIATGKPKPASRPMVLKSGKVVSDRSPDLVKWKAALRRSASGRKLPPDVPLSFVILFGMPHKDKRKHGKLHSVRPDFDNLAKAVLDAIQCDKKGPDQPLKDDGQIASSWILKVYSPKGFCRVIIHELADWDPQLAKDALDEAWHMPRGIRDMCLALKK